MTDEPRAQMDRGQRVIDELIAERVRFHYDLVPIDAQTWAIHGSIVVDGEVILAEFASRDDAWTALEQLSRAENRTATT
jgi:hypothetical protein